MKTEDTTSAKTWKNVCKEIRTRLSAGIQDVHRTRNEQAVYVHLSLCAWNRIRARGFGGMLVWPWRGRLHNLNKKNRWLTLPVKVGECSSSGVLAEVLPSMNLLKKRQNTQIARHPKGVKETPAGGRCQECPILCGQKPCGGWGWWVPLSKGVRWAVPGREAAVLGEGTAVPHPLPLPHEQQQLFHPLPPALAWAAPRGVHSVSRKHK